MSLNESIRYLDGALYIDGVSAEAIIAEVRTPVYVYSLKRALDNLARLQAAFAPMTPHVHYSAKANASLAVLRALLQAGVGIDCVSGGEVFKALQAGARGDQLVFAGVGKSRAEIVYALENGVGWFNVENVAELDLIEVVAAELGITGVQVALRLNPEVSANTHPHIATGHGGAKFGLTADVIATILATQARYSCLTFAGIHVHIGSQLHDVAPTEEAVTRALELIAPYESIHTINIGGGLPARYHTDEALPHFDEFAGVLAPLLRGYQVLLEPGRSIIADAGVLLTEVLYEKRQDGQRFIIVDASMTELMRPALYDAEHMIVPVIQSDAAIPTQVVGPVCETTDVLAHNINLPELGAGDHLAILTTGAYGAVMANQYNARPLPPEVVVEADGQAWRVVRQRQTWDDLIQQETL